MGFGAAPPLNLGPAGKTSFRYTKSRVKTLEIAAPNSTKRANGAQPTSRLEYPIRALRPSPCNTIRLAGLADNERGSLASISDFASLVRKSYSATLNIVSTLVRQERTSLFYQRPREKRTLLIDSTGTEISKAVGG